MTRPKRHLPGQVVFTTRRCSQRQFLIGTDSRELMGYMFGRALLASGCEVHAAIGMSNHVHYVYTDCLGKRSQLMQQFHSNFARKRNLQLGREENFWDSREPGDCALLDVEIILQKTLYTALNAVAAGLINCVNDWEGFMVLPEHWGVPMRFERPKECGRSMPEFVEFTPQPPPGFSHLTLEETRNLFEQKILELEQEYRRLRNIHTSTKMNDSTQVASSNQVVGRRRLNPRFSSENRRRAARAIRAQKVFEDAYARCLEAVRRGDMGVEFPAGAVKMVQIMGYRSSVAETGDPHLLPVFLSGAMNDNHRSGLGLFMRNPDGEPDD